MIKNISDPLYLSKQLCLEVPERQVKGLLPYVKAMVLECQKNGWYSMCAPQAGLNLRFFIAKSLNPKDQDYDTIFNPTYSPVQESGQTNVEEIGPDRASYRIKRWNKIRMTWYYHNGKAFERKTGEYEGDVAFIAQFEIDHLNGMYSPPE